MKVYLDICSYNRPYDPQEQLSVAMEAQSKLHIQNLIKEGKLELVSSFTVDYELSRNPFEMRKESIRKFIEENATEYVSAEAEKKLEPKVKELMNNGAKEKDAYHVASAIYAGCDYFISTDYRLLKKKVSGIRTVTPIDFVTETEGAENCLKSS